MKRYEAHGGHHTGLVCSLGESIAKDMTVGEFMKSKRGDTPI
jgi:hypothetical protein